MTLFRVEKFLDTHPSVDEKLMKIRDRSLIKGRGFEIIGSGEILKKIVIARSRARGY
ncbi:MAG: hypothetical protein IIC67_08120 [Thaumarchaeota archaeon]|nr:hypothetical protein [Nitrososphaerota archaeon]